MREQLTVIARLLRENEELAHAVLVEDAIAGTDDVLDAFLVSNALWGGSGSIADCALGGGRSDARRLLEDMLIRLGNDQRRRGTMNVRTALWVEAFTKWQGLKL